MCMFLGLQKWQCLPHYLIFIAICIKNESDCHKQMLRFRHLHSGPMSILFSYRNAVRVTCSDVMWLVALKRFPLCSVVPRNKAIGCTPSVDHRCRDGQQLGWDDYEYEELDIGSAWIFFFFLQGRKMKQSTCCISLQASNSMLFAGIQLVKMRFESNISSICVLYGCWLPIKRRMFPRHFDVWFPV